MDFRNVHGIETKDGMAYFVYAGPKGPKGGVAELYPLATRGDIAGAHLYLLESGNNLRFQPVCVEKMNENPPIFIPQRPARDSDRMCLHCHRWVQQQDKDTQ